MSPVPQNYTQNCTCESFILRRIGLDVAVDVGNPTSSATRARSQVFSTTGTPNLSNVDASFKIFDSSGSSSIVHQDNYQTTFKSSSSTALLTCNGVCIAGVVVAALVMSCFSFGLFLCLGKGCRRNIYRWIRSYYSGQARTNLPVVAAPIQLNPRSSQVLTTSTELLPLPPYPEDRLPPYSNNAPANNTDVNADSQTDDNPSATTLTSQFSIPPADTNSVTSANTTIDNDNEFPMPPTPSIPTIPLPPLSSSDHVPQRDSSSDSESDDRMNFHFPDNQPVDNDSPSEGLQLEF